MVVFIGFLEVTVWLKGVSSQTYLSFCVNFALAELLLMIFFLNQGGPTKSYCSEFYLTLVSSSQILSGSWNILLVIADLDRCLMGRIMVKEPFILILLIVILILQRFIIENVRMQIKRSPISPLPIQPHKNANLFQPLMNISKASTPVRTRLVAPTPQPNSTPISINKLSNNISKSPNNKQNFEINQYRAEVSSKFFSHGPDTENRINLSPILALNRKLNEGPQNYNKKSFTPEGHKIIEQYEGFTNFGHQQLQRNYSTHYMNDSKGKSLILNTSNLANLRGSNCFKALIQHRNKSPNKLQGSNGKQIQKKDSINFMKESMGSNSNTMFKNFGRDSKSKLLQSRSFDNLKTFGSNKLELSEIKCMNNDGKKAKYRVKSSEEQTTFDQTQLYYCSKCTIPLVQQGFIVEQIGRQTSRNDNQHPQARRYNDYTQKLQKKRKQVQNLLTQLQTNEQKEINSLSQFYKQVLEYLQGQRISDLRVIEEYYQQKKQEPINFLQKINSCCEAIDEITSNSARKPAKLEQIQQILQTNKGELVSSHNPLLQSSLEDLFSKFTATYESNFKIVNLSRTQSQEHQQINPTKPNNEINSRNHAMRFSFQKLIQEMNVKKVNRREISPLNEVDEQEENEGVQPQKQEHGAFRDLFPEEDENSHVQTGVHSPTFKNF